MSVERGFGVANQNRPTVAMLWLVCVVAALGSLTTSSGRLLDPPPPLHEDGAHVASGLKEQWYVLE